MLNQPLKPSRCLIRVCKTSILAKVRFQLYFSPVAAAVSPELVSAEVLLLLEPLLVEQLLAVEANVHILEIRIRILLAAELVKI